MKLSPKQIRSLHWAARQAGYKSDAMRHSIQLNIGGTYSAADRTWTRQGFIAVMAFYEDACEGQLINSDPGYWRAESDKASPTDTLLYKVSQLRERLGWTAQRLDTFVASNHLTSGRYARVADAPAYWLRRLIEALKAILSREDDGSKARAGAQRLQGPGTVSGSDATARADLPEPVEVPF